jgi:hypothetical protein
MTLKNRRSESFYKPPPSKAKWNLFFQKQNPKRSSVNSPDNEPPSKQNPPVD